MALSENAERYIKVAQKDDSGLDDIDRNLVLMVAENEKLNVTPIIHSGLASPATLHKRLKGLYENGFLQINSIENEYPKRAVTLGRAGRDWLNKMGKAVKEAAR